MSARYEPETGRVVFDLVNGCGHAFPAVLVEDLRGGSPDDLADARADELGFNPRFPAPDVDLYGPALLSGLLASAPG